MEEESDLDTSTSSYGCSCNHDPLYRLRVLAIHGYRQNAEVFKAKTGSLRKMLHRLADFFYVTAPHKVLLVDDIDNVGATPPSDAVDNDQFGWFFNRNNKTFRGIRKGGPAIGFEDSIAFIEEIFENEGPFDGILGFSQGACFLGLLCDLQQKGLLNFKFNFAIFASGFKSGCFPHSKYYDELISLPTLHIYGENDNIIPKEMSIELCNSFEKPQVLVHPGGHYLPATAAQRKAYIDFFKMLMNEVL